jgi:hypothetical protein
MYNVRRSGNGVNNVVGKWMRERVGVRKLM